MAKRKRKIYVVTRTVSGNTIGQAVPNLGVFTNFKDADRHYRSVIEERLKRGYQLHWENEWNDNPKSKSAYLTYEHQKSLRCISEDNIRECIDWIKSVRRRSDVITGDKVARIVYYLERVLDIIETEEIILEAWDV